MIAVDTSAWIAFLQGERGRDVDVLDRALRDRQVADAVVDALDPIQQRYREITKESGYIEKVLEEGARRVGPIARGTVHTAKKAMGLFTSD